MTKTEAVTKVLTEAKEAGLHRGMLYYGSFICGAPGHRLRTRMGNTHTPAGHVTVPNPNYNKELTEWKKTKLFPFFLEHGFGREELNEAWKKSVWKK
jgi:hypothetical protein